MLSWQLLSPPTNEQPVSVRVDRSVFSEDMQVQYWVAPLARGSAGRSVQTDGARCHQQRQFAGPGALATRPAKEMERG